MRCPLSEANRSDLLRIEIGRAGGATWWELASRLLKQPAAMRNLLLATGLTLLASACTSSPDQLPDPPVLKITSPQRSLIQDHAGKIMVTGTVAPNPAGTPVKAVLVNNVAAAVNADGTFSASIDIKPGATLIHTEATDNGGGKATDTRSVEAGELRPPGANIQNAVTADISAQAFAKISDVASGMIKMADLSKLIAPMQPMVNAGGSCLGVKGYVDTITMTDAHISLVPVAGGLQFRAEIDGLNIQGHASFKVACIGASDTFGMTADAVVVSGTLDVAPNGMMGFTTTLVSPNVAITNLNVSAGGIPQSIINLLDVNGLMSFAISKGAEMFMGPMMNKALGGLAGPQKLNLLGKTIDVQVAPSDVQFTAASGLIVLDMRFLIEGSETSKGFIFTDNGMPTMDAGAGMQLGIADDLANEMMSEFTALGMLNLSLPQNGGTFDSTTMAATSPPMISADPADGKMKLVLPDMMQTFTLHGVPVAKAALNATIELNITPASNGYAVALNLGAPTINVDVLDDIANGTRFTNDDLSTAVKLCIDGQIKSLSGLLGGIPLPAMAGIQMRNLSIGAQAGYVMVKGDIQ